MISINKDKIMYIKIFVLLMLVTGTLLSAKKTYDESVKFEQLVFHYDKIDKNSKSYLDEIMKRIEKYQQNSKKMKLEISFYSNDVGEDNADYVQEYLTDKGIKEKRIKQRSFYLKSEEKHMNNINLTLFVNYEKDKDGDGVLRAVDECPDTPKGYEVNPNGCAIPDKDMDGVLIQNDKCPNTPKGYDVTSDGCTIPDKDMDGVLIENDQCPNTPKGYEVNPNGCAIPDKDMDGVLIQNDKCPNTPKGVRVGVYGCKMKTLMLVRKNNMIEVIQDYNSELDKGEIIYFNQKGIEEDSKEDLTKFLLQFLK